MYNAGVLLLLLEEPLHALADVRDALLQRQMRVVVQELDHHVGPSPVAADLFKESARIVAFAVSTRHSLELPGIPSNPQDVLQVSFQLLGSPPSIFTNFRSPPTCLGICRIPPSLQGFRQLLVNFR